jgi:hypothetical protein
MRNAVDIRQTSVSDCSMKSSNGREGCREWSEFFSALARSKHARHGQTPHSGPIWQLFIISSRAEAVDLVTAMLSGRRHFEARILFENRLNEDTFFRTARHNDWTVGPAGEHSLTRIQPSTPHF